MAPCGARATRVSDALRINPFPPQNLLFTPTPPREYWDGQQGRVGGVNRSPVPRCRSLYGDWHPDTGFVVARALKRHGLASEIHQAMLDLIATAPLEHLGSPTPSSCALRRHGRGMDIIFETPRLYVAPRKSVLFFARVGDQRVRCYIEQDALVEPARALREEADIYQRCLRAFDHHKHLIQADGEAPDRGQRRRIGRCSGSIERRARSSGGDTTTGPREVEGYGVAEQTQIAPSEYMRVRFGRRPHWSRSGSISSSGLSSLCGCSHSISAPR